MVDDTANTGDRQRGEREIKRILTFLLRIPQATWKALDRREPGAARAVVQSILLSDEDGDDAILAGLNQESLTQGFRRLTRFVHPDQFHYRGDGQLQEQANLVQSLLNHCRRMGMVLVEDTVHRERQTFTSWMRQLREAADLASRWATPEPVEAAPLVPRPEAPPQDGPREPTPAPPKEPAEPRRTWGPPPTVQPPSVRPRASMIDDHYRSEAELRRRPESRFDAEIELPLDEARWVLLVTQLQNHGWRNSTQTAWLLLCRDRAREAITPGQYHLAYELAARYARNPALYEEFKDGERALIQTELWKFAPFELTYLTEVVSFSLRERLHPTAASDAAQPPASERMIERYVLDLLDLLSIPDRRALAGLLKRSERVLTQSSPAGFSLRHGEEQLLGRLRGTLSRVLSGRAPSQRRRIWDGFLQALRAMT